MSIDYYFENADSLINDSFEAQLERISPFRQNRVNSYKQDVDKRLCLAATLLLDKALSKYDLAERDMSYAVGKYGKPYFDNTKNIHFSLSHSGGYVAVAISDNEIGCDIQKRVKVYTGLADRYFTEYERDYIKNTDDFFRIWTLKESFIKAVGRGLSMPLSSFCIENLDSKPYVIFESKKYTFIEKEFKDYNIAVCK